MALPVARYVQKWKFLLWEARPENALPVTAKALLQALICCGDEKQRVLYPSEETLAKKANVSRNTAHANLVIAEEQGWIKTTKSKGKGQAWAQKRYRLTFPVWHDRTKDEWEAQVTENIAGHRKENWINGDVS